jgi:hypothetical protein
MSNNLTGLTPRYLRTPEAARFVGLSIRTLEKHRKFSETPAAMRSRPRCPEGGPQRGPVSLFGCA